MKVNLSVIIPVFNASDKIARCLTSIMHNTIHLQIIIVNDHSDDNLLEILQDYSMVQIINLPFRHGVSFARNEGLKYVKGEYFTFVDADDYVKNNIYDLLYDEAIKQDLDVCGMNYYDQDSKSKYTYNNEVMDATKVKEKILKDQLSLVIWDKIYKTSIFQNKQFNEKLIINEDYVYSLNYLIKSKRFKMINEYGYYYLNNQNSLTSQYTCKMIEENLYWQYLDPVYPFDNAYLVLYLLQVLHLFAKCKDQENRYQYIKKHISKKVLKQNLLKISSFSKRMEGLIYLINIKLYLKLFSGFFLIKKYIRK